MELDDIPRKEPDAVAADVPEDLPDGTGDDEESLARSARDPSAFEPLVTRHAHVLHGYLTRRAPAAADDLLAEVWLRWDSGCGRTWRGRSAPQPLGPGGAGAIVAVVGPARRGGPAMPQDEAVIGRTGKVLVTTRGATGPGEVLVRVRGGSETFLAWSDDPLPVGTTVLVVHSRGLREVDVIEWLDPVDPLDALGGDTPGAG